MKFLFDHDIEYLIFVCYLFILKKLILISLKNITIKISILIILKMYIICIFYKIAMK